MSIIAYIIAIVCFLLVVFNATPGDSDQIDLLAVGLAAFALGHVAPNGYPSFWPRRGRE